MRHRVGSGGEMCPVPIVSIDAIGNSNVFRYDPIFLFLPKEAVVYKAGQAISTNELIYGNSSNVVTGNCALYELRFRDGAFVAID